MAVASCGSKKLSDLGFVINPKKKNMPEAVSGFEALDDPASISHSSQQVNRPTVNPPTSIVDIVWV